jgi:4-azaleucine resistance transporter AzlC
MSQVPQPDAGPSDTPDPSFWAAFRAGCVAMIPLWLSSAPFGAIYAVEAQAAGLSLAQILVMSLIVFAGASQMTAARMFSVGAAPISIIFTTLIINARHVLLTAALAPHIRQEKPAMRTLLAAQLTDESFAMGTKAFISGQGSAAYQLGCNLSLYVVWTSSSLLGALIGAQIDDPAAYGIDLVFPLTFIGLLVPLLRDKISVQVAMYALILTVASALVFPGSWYILIAGICASGIGAWLKSKQQDPA